MTLQDELNEDIEILWDDWSITIAYVRPTVTDRNTRTGVQTAPETTWYLSAVQLPREIIGDLKGLEGGTVEQGDLVLLIRASNDVSEGLTVEPANGDYVKISPSRFVVSIKKYQMIRWILEADWNAYAILFRKMA